jgi:membrane-associated phospholipid phosphatase
LLAALAVAFGPTWFAVVLVIWAPLVALARVAMGVHYFSDVFVGGLFGIFIGYIVASIGIGVLISEAII